MYFDPFNEIKRLRKEMDLMFSRFFREPRSKMLDWNKQLTSFREPLSDVIEQDNEILVNIELPGIDKKDIILNITDDHIEIKAEKKHEVKIAKKGLHRYERSYSGFYRVISLPKNVKADQAEAKYENGILRIKIPKEKKSIEKGKKILIK